MNPQKERTLYSHSAPEGRGSEGAKNSREGSFYSFQAVTEDGARLKRKCRALPRTPLKKLFEKSFFRIFQNFQAFKLIENFRAKRGNSPSFCRRQIIIRRRRLSFLRSKIIIPRSG
jgi:hypothetical protein